MGTVFIFLVDDSFVGRGLINGKVALISPPSCSKVPWASAWVWKMEASLCNREWELGSRAECRVGKRSKEHLATFSPKTEAQGAIFNKILLR